MFKSYMLTQGKPSKNTDEYYLIYSGTDRFTI